MFIEVKNVKFDPFCDEKKLDLGWIFGAEMFLFKFILFISAAQLSVTFCFTNVPLLRTA